MTRGKITKSELSEQLKSKVDSFDNHLINKATQAEALAGTDNNKWMTPLSTTQLLNNTGLLSVRAVTTLQELDSIRTNDYFRMAHTVAPDLGLFPGTYIVKSYGGGTISYQDFTLINTERLGATFRRIYGTVIGGWQPLFPTSTGSLNDLQTTAKNNLVAAINEVKQQANSVSQNHYGVATGDSLLTITANPVPTSLYAGLTIQFKNTTANTGNVTINVNGLGYKNLTNNDGTQIQAGKLKPNSIYSAVYDGTNFCLVKGGGEQNPVKGVQRGTSVIQGDSLSVTTPINAVDSSKSIIKFTIRRDVAVSGSSSTFETFGYFASNSSITFTRMDNFTSGVQPGVMVHWEVVEFNENVRVLQGSANLNAVTLLDVTISSVDVSKSILFFSNTSSGGEYAAQVSGQIVTGTTLRFSKALSSGSHAIQWFVVEFQ